MNPAALLVAALLPGAVLAQKTTLEETDQNFSESKEQDAWIYNDLEKGLAEGKAKGKPVMVVYRCIP